MLKVSMFFWHANVGGTAGRLNRSSRPLSEGDERFFIFMNDCFRKKK